MTQTQHRRAQTFVATLLVFTAAWIAFLMAVSSPPARRAARYFLAHVRAGQVCGPDWKPITCHDCKMYIGIETNL